MSQLTRFLKAMFGIGVAGVNSDFWYFLSCNAVLLIVLVLCSMDHRAWIGKLRKKSADAVVREGSIYVAVEQSRGLMIVKPAIMLALLFLSYAFLVGDSYNPFLYFRF